MDLPKPPFKLTPLACFFLLLFTTIIRSPYARTLGGIPPPPPPKRRHHHPKTMTFYMPNILNSTIYHPPTNQINTQPIPFSKPLGLFPPIGGIPVSDSNSISSQPFGLAGAGIGTGTGISFSASDILREELEFGMVNTIDVDLLDKTNLYGLTLLGKAKGMYVASLENGSSQMMAMTTSFVDNEFKDELRFFGLHQADINSVSHVSIIGGSGKYKGANGYATIKLVKLRSKSVQKHGGSDSFLLVDVYLG
ncbi:dirigent protein 16-like [Bidens hawaiensis]|uniref:dirigent protein 16-like n=1 Tax=Bidens hawaiensis TaxID=980011 RepID=UPI00404985E7